MKRALMKSAVAVLAAMIVTAGSASAQTAAHPSLSGTWTMDADKSEKSPLTPSAMTYTVEQNGDQLKVQRDMTNQAGHQASGLLYGIDGKPWKNTFKQGTDDVTITSVLSWDGPTLVISSDLMVQGQAAKQTDRWTVAPDGKTMTIERAIDVMGQHIGAKLLLVKS